MIYKILETMDKKKGIEEVQAHCDIPCGIYDPITAQITALTVVRMVDIIEDLEKVQKEKDPSYLNTFTRAVLVKEEHAEKTKHEIRVIWGDYIKPAHLEKYPDLHKIVHNVMQLGSKARQTVDRDAAVQLVEEVNKFAEIFWQTKGVETKRAAAPYKPSLELVYPKL